MEIAKLMENDERRSSCEMNFNHSYGSIAIHERDRVYIREMMGVVNSEDGLWFIIQYLTTGSRLLLE